MVSTQQGSMNNKQLEVYVFRTNVTTRDVENLSPMLNSIPRIDCWNFDLEDCDNILRAVTDEDGKEELKLIMQQSGFTCEELE
jgi:hypothetical protein